MNYQTLVDIKNTSFTFSSPTNIHPKEHRIVLRNYGIIDPLNIEHYIAKDGYFALEKALKQEPLDVINEVITSNIRGRGGVGFPTGLKWKFTSQNDTSQKYIICNADEGEPGTFMDKHILEGDPHSVLEGMALAGYAIGADKGYIYLRLEYPLAKDILEKAIDDAKEYNLLGENILGSDFSFDIEVRMGAGAFICGEETSLLESLEGKRGESRNKPPYPANVGLFRQPTAVNNVETLSNIPQIILQGGQWFKGIGTEGSSGTKVLSISGKINTPGLYEVDMGISVREIIEDLGGGMKKGSSLSYIVLGGPSGGFITPDELDAICDFDSLAEYGAILGSGGVIVFDQDDCVIDTLKVFMDFNRDESCGKCTPCREGTKIMSELLEDISLGHTDETVFKRLRQLGKTMQRASLCGLGQAAPDPVFSALDKFKHIFTEHLNHTCRSNQCTKEGDIHE